MSEGDLSTPEVLPIVWGTGPVSVWVIREATSGLLRAAEPVQPAADAGEVGEAGHAVAGRLGDRWELSRRDVRGYGLKAIQLCRRTGVP